MSLSWSPEDVIWDELIVANIYYFTYHYCVVVSSFSFLMIYSFLSQLSTSFYDIWGEILLYLLALL